MKHILDPSFRYHPSFDTDVRRTFERVREQQRALGRGQAKADPAGRPEVLQLAAFPRRGRSSFST